MSQVLPVLRDPLGYSFVSCKFQYMWLDNTQHLPTDLESRLRKIPRKVVNCSASHKNHC